MKNQDFTTTIVVGQSPREALAAIKNIPGWWSEEVKGKTDKVGDEFSYHYRDVHRCKMKMIELIPDVKVVWLVTENHFNFTKDQTEWQDTRISFELHKKAGKTQIRFTHHGLVPAQECYDICSNAWTGYIQDSLVSLITTGRGKPNPKEAKAS